MLHYQVMRPFKNRWLRAAWLCAVCLLFPLCQSGCWFIDSKRTEPTPQILVSEDQGVTWKNWTTLEADWFWQEGESSWLGQGLWNDGKGNFFLLLSYDGVARSKIYRGNAKGRKWVLEVDKDIELEHLWGSSDGELYISGAWGNIYHRKSELDWEKIPFPTRDSINQLWGTSSKDLFAVTHRGFYHSLNGGMTWTVLRESPMDVVDNPQDSFHAVWGFSARELFLAGYPGLLLSSNDGGRTWDKRLRGANDLFDAVWGTEEGLLLVSNYDGYVHRSTDRGKTFTKHKTPFVNSGNRLGNAVGDLWGKSGSFVLATGIRGGILRSTDGGQSWAVVHADKEYRRNRLYSAPDGKLYAIGEPEFRGGGGSYLR